MKAHFIFYVSSQEKSTKFYELVLDQKPTLNVPGMTEFKLNDGSVLGLMPAKGIKQLLGEKLPDPESAGEAPRAELYLVVDNPGAYHQRALEAGATELSDLQKRDWGDEAAYSLDLDSHVIVFAKHC
ncbi:VOC family protein [Candidatus Leptofilum sp.]|uniref:VOC family protein n=1 Tax=Candidatus Leptofilum sp. TaxID=3241576 RepID=UPI003B5AA341